MSKELSEEELKELIKSFITDSLNKKLYNTSEINPKYKDKKFENLNIKVSFGLGVPAKVSWIAFLGFNQSVRKGINPVILFNRKDCLVLAFGVSEDNDPDINWPDEVKNNYKQIENAQCSCNLSEIKNKYPKSYLKECYQITNNQINQNQLDDLIKNLIEIIELYKEHMQKLTKNEQSSQSNESNEDTHKNNCLNNSNLKLTLVRKLK